MARQDLLNTIDSTRAAFISALEALAASEAAAGGTKVQPVFKIDPIAVNENTIQRIGLAHKVHWTLR